MDKSIWKSIRTELRAYVWDRRPGGRASEEGRGLSLAFLSEALNVPFHTRRKLVKRLASAYEDSRLTMVVGAGISLEHGLPTWNELLLEVLVSAVGTACIDSDHLRSFCRLYGHLFFDSPLVAARQIECLLGRTSRSRGFLSAVRDVFYKHEAFNTESLFYKSLANLCASSRTSKSIASVITYNFDNMLEVYLDKLKVRVPYRTIAGPRLVKLDNSCLPIYHVHGFLPKHSHATPQTVVLSEQDYHNLYSKPLHWSNMVQLRAFSEDICLFVGLSMQDPNLRRLLDASARLSARKKSQHHVVVLKAPSPSDLGQECDHLKNHSLISPLLATKEDMDAWLKGVCEFHKRTRLLEMQSLCCDVLYVDSFVELPSIIDDIRQGA